MVLIYLFYLFLNSYTTDPKTRADMANHINICTFAAAAWKNLINPLHLEIVLQQKLPEEHAHSRPLDTDAIQLLGVHGSKGLIEKHISFGIVFDVSHNIVPSTLPPETSWMPSVNQSEGILHHLLALPASWVCVKIGCPETWWFTWWFIHICHEEQTAISWRHTYVNHLPSG